MSSVVISGDTSGAITLQAPAVSGNTTLNLPASSGTLLTTASTSGANGSAISTGIVAEAFGGTGTSTGYYGFKNRIINGAFDVWQRGTSFSASGGNFYTSDRWQTLSQQGTYARSTDVPSGFRYSLSITSTSSFYGTIAQRIEAANTEDLAGQTVTISFWAKATTGGASGLGISLDYANAVDNFSSTTYIGGGTTAALTSTWTRYSVTISNLNANAVNGLQLYIYNLAGGAAAITYLIAGIQLEKGATATSFDYRPFGTELMLCQRYYWKTFVVDTAPAQNVAPGNQIFNICTNNISNGLYFPVSMRGTPTITTFNPYAANASFRVPNSTTDVSVTPAEISASGIGFFVMTRTAPSALHGHVTASAEL